MSLEQKVRDSLAAQVAEPPAALDLATRSLQGAKAVRRRRTAVAAMAVAVVAIAVPVALRPSGSPQTPMAPPTPTTSDRPHAMTVLPIGEPPPVEFLIGDKLIRPSEALLPELPDFDRERSELFSTLYGTVIKSPAATARATDFPASFRIHVVRPNGQVQELIKGDVRGFALDSTRFAYSVYNAVPGEEAPRLDLVLADFRSPSTIQLLEYSPIVTAPVAFADGLVVMIDGSGPPESSVSSWLLTTNTHRPMYETSGGDFPLDAVGDVALIAQGDRSCVAVVEVATGQKRSSSPCQPGSAGNLVERFGLLSPDGQRYVGTQSDTDTATPGRAWPVVGDSATGRLDDRFRGVFAAAGLHVGDQSTRQLVWEDATHIVVVGQADDDERKLILRCDVVAATCEIAHDTGVPAVPRVTLARPF